MRREARMRTWRSENFFSSSRVELGILAMTNFCRRMNNGRRIKEKRRLPLLNLVETLEERNGNENDNCLLAVANFELVRKTS